FPFAIARISSAEYARFSSAMAEFSYVGTELDVFRYATNWKAYVREKLRKYLVGRVLEAGAGICGGSALLYDGTQEKWVCLEPDRELAQRIPVSSLSNPERCEVRFGTLVDIDEGEQFDCVVYMDVLEHIEDDAGELARAAARLETGGHIVVLSPALPSLYTEFDAAIGHCRRVKKASLLASVRVGEKEETCIYLDSLGGLLSLGNRFLLHSATPKKRQILFWDRVVVPVSRITDRLMGYSSGRSILAVWKKT